MQMKWVNVSLETKIIEALKERSAKKYCDGNPFCLNVCIIPKNS